MSETQAWVAVIAFIVAVEKYLKDNGKPMLTHVVHRSRMAQVVVLIVALHLLDTKERLPVDLVSILGRKL